MCVSHLCVLQRWLVAGGSVECVCLSPVCSAALAGSWRVCRVCVCLSPVRSAALAGSWRVCRVCVSLTCAFCSAGGSVECV